EEIIFLYFIDILEMVIILLDFIFYYIINIVLLLFFCLLIFFINVNNFVLFVGYVMYIEAGDTFLAIFGLSVVCRFGKDD
ncbi:hypothetical protein Q0M83_14760, partial [Staphylococcus aureus]|nr:hypothetical protein [Staphylococcus aureus]